MRKPEVAALVRYLLDMADQGFTLLTWNGLGFDLPVLAEESAMLDECRRLAGPLRFENGSFFGRRPIGFPSNRLSEETVLNCHKRIQIAKKLWRETVYG